MCDPFTSALCTVSITCDWALQLQGGADALATGDDKAWGSPLGAAILAIRHIGLGGWQQQECLALENELGCWQGLGKLSEPLNMLRWAWADLH